MAVLTRDWRKTQNDRNDRIGGVFAGAHDSSSAQWVVQPGILSASKTILGESDLIHNYSGRQAEGF